MSLSRRASAFFLRTIVMAALLSVTGFAQVADGNLVGTVYDATGKVIPEASVAAKNTATGVVAETKSDQSGAYRFNNLLVGVYSLTASSANFSSTQIKDLSIELNKTATANITLAVSAVTESIDVVDSTTLIDTTTAQIANIYASRLAADNPVAAFPAGGYLNLSLLGAGVAGAGGVGAGTGPSVGGQRPRNNNFMVEGTDNNRKDVTGPVVNLPNDSVAEFSVLQNQFSAEFGHSSGGQFSAVIRRGSNDLHGKIYDYLDNRNLNALDQFWKRQGIFTQPRYDYNLLGGALGGPIKKNKIFYYGNFDYNPVGFAATATSNVYAPTAEGYAAIAGLAGVSPTNLSVMQQYVGAAPQQTNGFATTVKGVAIPVGIVPILAPSYQNTYRWLASGDYNISERDQLRVRYVENDISRIDSSAALPAFYFPRPIKAKLFSASEFHAFRPSLANELRLAYNRYADRTGVPDNQFPGLDMFPNIVLRDLGTQIGPSANAPQSVTQNTYQIADNLTWIKGNHSLKFGFDGRDNISSINFISGIRGNYQYRTMERYLLDLVPDFTAQRAVGGSKPYSGNNYALYLFGNDDWKVTRNFSISLGLRYEFTAVPRSMKEYALNSLADVPGVLTFFEPQPQKKNFAPRIGFAYSPGKSASTSIRGGFGIAYDQIFDNIGTNVRPPQVNSVVNSILSDTPGYLANGGILPSTQPATLTAAQARAATSGWLGDQQLGYAINWNFGVQHVFAKDYVVDVRYLGSKGVHLLMQTQLGRTAVVTDTNYLPTYLQAPSQADLNSLPLSLAQLTAQRNAGANTLAPYGFNSIITSYVPQGNSEYHGLAVDVSKRFSSHLTFKGAYTWSHLMDDSTMELNFTSLTPRRPQDFMNLRPEWASSALDRRHRATLTWLYQTPWFEKNQNWWLRNLAGNYQFAGVYTAESPEWVTPQSATDANMNTDAIGDRVIVNNAGVAGTGSDVTQLKNSAGQVVAYLAVNPNARFIRAAQGALATSGRNILPTQGINSFDLNVIKAFTAGERYRVEVRGDFYNALNHPQYTTGWINSVLSASHVNETNYLTPGNPLFGKWDQVFGSNARVIQLSAKLSF
ncbi:MAG TPA: carboxypeptidase regulatory-like domain-containing protein [Bryobacteraceae bacterium]|nr:carboxypeptidase regulatory-like domain-containing protein [Bryobacteraceae bacterium]